MDDDKLTKLLQEMEARIHQRLDRVDENHAQLKRYVADFRAEVIGRLDVIESRLDRIDAAIVSVDVRLASQSKSIADFGSFATKFTIEQANQRRRIADLEDLTKPAA
jgi:hypothetical protein